MADLFTIGVAATNQTPLDWAGNLKRVLVVIKEAADRSCDLVLLHELCLTGYGCEDAFLMPETWRQADESLEAVAEATAGLATMAVVGLPIYHRGALYNCAAVVSDGHIQGLFPKRHLAGDGLHYEPRWFKPWPSEDAYGDWIGPDGSGRVCSIIPDGFEIVGGGRLVRLAFEICEDAWVPQARRPDVDIILNPSASHFAFGKHEVRRRLVTDASRSFCGVYAYANALGNEAGRVVYDGDCFIAVAGTMVAEGRRFSFSDHTLTVATVDLDVVRAKKAATASFVGFGRRDDWTQVDRVRSVDADYEPRAPETRALAEGVDLSKCEEFQAAAALGLYDYCRKAGARGYVVSLSGGADSACCAQLVSDAWDRAAAELGGYAAAVRLLGSVNVVDWEAPSITSAGMRRSLLTCVWQTGEGSTDATAQAAASVAQVLGADFVCDSIVEPFRRFKAAVSAAEGGRPLDWTSPREDVVLQNLQARLRVPLPWALANLRHQIPLCTSNRSEAAVGYCTMDGDTMGALAPIAGVDKPFILEWLRWRAAEGDRDPGYLYEVLALKPSAELRPQAMGAQTDEADLMPYAVLDFCQRSVVCDRRSPEDTLAALRAAFPSVSAADTIRYVIKFYKLFAQSQWKRERFAPALHMDDHNLDPRSALRLPILSGGFRAELAVIEANIYAYDDKATG